MVARTEVGEGAEEMERWIGRGGEVVVSARDQRWCQIALFNEDSVHRLLEQVGRLEIVYDGSLLPSAPPRDEPTHPIFAAFWAILPGWDETVATRAA